jgi:hypothetical protein
MLKKFSRARASSPPHPALFGRMSVLLRHDEQYRSTNAARSDTPRPLQNFDSVVEFVVRDGRERPVKFSEGHAVFDPPPKG